MSAKDPRLRHVWQQTAIPVVFRPSQGPLLIRLPYSGGNRAWLQKLGRINPVWNEKRGCWQLPKTWFERTIRAALEKYGRIYAIHPFKHEEKCAPACWNAVGVDCQCQCMGEYHGSAEPAGRWHTVSEALAVKWEEREYACRLLKPAGSHAVR